MEYIITGFNQALKIILSLDRDFLAIVLTSLKLAFISTLLAASIGIPLGTVIAYKKFPGKNFIISFFNALIALPTVLIGLLVYSFLSRRGPLGEFNLLYTISAIIIGQFILILPLVTSLTIANIRNADKRIYSTLLSLGADRLQRLMMIIYELRLAMMAVIFTAFSRVFAEVGISMMLGGNIKAYTRTITTAIALETSKGEFALGIALGLILLLVAFIINGTVAYLENINNQ